MKHLSKITLLFMFLTLAFSATAQTPKRTLSVGIVVYPGVEILDFSGPSEVFAATNGFKPFLVAFKKEPLKSQGFVTVTPEYSIEDCPPTDILLFPGGGTGSVINEPAFIEWIKARAKTTQFMVSVCTGAGLLSKAGLLDGLEVTTFHGYLKGLQEMTPTAKVLSETRFVDNGHIITTAGVSAGIDGALHLVARIKGEAVAKATAYYMEYDKWQPNMGKVNETPFVNAVRKEGLEAAIKKITADKNSLQPLYYDGEMVDLANELMDKNPAQSAAIFKWMISNLPPNVTLYDGLAKAYKKMGKAAPDVDSKTFLDKIIAGEVAWAKKTQQTIAKSNPGWLLFTEEDLNGAAYQAYTKGHKAAAIEVAKWITELYPNSPNAWDTLSECHEMTGEMTAAVAASQRCLSLLPASDYDEHRKEMLAKASKDRIERLGAK